MDAICVYVTGLARSPLCVSGKTLRDGFHRLSHGTYRRRVVPRGIARCRLHASPYKKASLVLTCLVEGNLSTDYPGMGHVGGMSVMRSARPRNRKLHALVVSLVALAGILCLANTFYYLTSQPSQLLAVPATDAYSQGSFSSIVLVHELDKVGQEEAQIQLLCTDRASDCEYR